MNHVKRLVKASLVTTTLLVYWVSPTLFGLVNLTPKIAEAAVGIAAMISVFITIIYLTSPHAPKQNTRPSLYLTLWQQAAVLVFLAIVIGLTARYLDANSPETATQALFWEVLLTVLHIALVVGSLGLVLSGTIRPCAHEGEDVR